MNISGPVSDESIQNPPSVDQTTGLRIGSPFDGSSWPADQSAGFNGEGQSEYLRRAAVLAAAVIVPNAIAAAMYFPAGGLTVAVLGLALSATGLASRWNRRALITMTLHGGTLIWTIATM